MKDVYYSYIIYIIQYYAFDSNCVTRAYLVLFQLIIIKFTFSINQNRRIKIDTQSIKIQLKCITYKLN